MSRSRVLVGFLAAALLALTARSAAAQSGQLFDAIGEVDYAHGRSVLQVGSWARYHVVARRDGVVTDDYTATVMIAGEEEWWGEECFWVETTTQWPKGATTSAATLMSMSIFEDSLPLKNILLYQRKRIAELDENGQPLQQTMRRGRGAIKTRTPAKPGLTTLVDTLGVDTLQFARGALFCLKVRNEKGTTTTSQSADSSRYTETRDVRVSWQTPQVPVTGKAREEIEFSNSSRTWLTGHSQASSPLRLIDRTSTVMELGDYGTGGVEATLVPKEFRRSLAAQRAAPAPGPKAPAAKPGRPTR